MSLANVSPDFTGALAINAFRSAKNKADSGIADIEQFNLARERYKKAGGCGVGTPGGFTAKDLVRLRRAIFTLEAVRLAGIIDQTDPAQAAQLAQAIRWSGQTGRLVAA